MKTGKLNLKWCDLDMSQLDLAKLVSHFAQSNKAEGKSPKTVAWYSEMLFGFIRYLRSTGKAAILSQLDATSVRQFILQEQARGLSPFTIQAKARALKVFSSWLAAEGYTTDNMLANVKLPKVPVRMIQPLTGAEIDQLVSTQNLLTAIGCRNTAILITLLDTGLRAGELSSLHFEDAHIDEGYLKVLGKGGRERIVPLGALAQKLLWRYVFHFRPQPASSISNFLFLTLDGKPLTLNAIKLLLARWGKKAGVPRLHAHLCRHTFATSFLNHKCGDVFRLKQILGHSTLEMVNRYVHYASVQDMLQGHVSSPIDRIGIKRLGGYKIDRFLKASRG